MVILLIVDLLLCMVGGNYGLGPCSNPGSCGCWRAVSGSREKCLAGGSDYCVKFSFCVCGVGGRLNFAQHLFA